MLPRMGLALSLLLTIGWLLIARWQPTIDPIIHIPGAHFYIVTFFTFIATVAAIFAAVAGVPSGRVRHRLLATAFVAMGATFLIHGITTPEALITGFNPGVVWAAWLTLFIGGAIFAIAALDRPERPLPISFLRPFHLLLLVVIVLFAAIVFFTPHWLTYIDEQVAPWHQQTAFYTTLALWLVAAAGLGRTWHQSQNRVDGVMFVVAIWSSLGTISMHAFPAWHLSWWIYHILLLASVTVALITLTRIYEKRQDFSLFHYSAALGLVATGVLALLGAYLVGELVQRNLAMQHADLPPADLAALLSAFDYMELTVRARRLGLLIVGGSAGFLYLALIVVVRRANRLVSVRNQELASAYAELRGAQQLQEELTGMIVHDLRTPLTSMRLNVELAEKIVDLPEQVDRRRRLMGNLRQSVGRMLTLVDQILDTARLETGQLPVHRESFSISSLLEEKAQAFALQAEAEQKAIGVEFDLIDLPLAADPALIGRVLDNLIGNAFKFTQPGGRVTLRAQRVNGSVLIQVNDDGEGIDPAAAGQLFDKFYQVADQDGLPMRRGTGLGLTFCKLVVEAHQGQIWVDSQPGAGSRFTFSLPVNTP